jgi:hypothetical protein
MVINDFMCMVMCLTHTSHFTFYTDFHFLEDVLQTRISTKRYATHTMGKL